jgi:hypothetical protein
MRIKRLPNMLAVHLKRFALGEIKLSWRVAHPTELRLFNSVRDCVFFFATGGVSLLTFLTVSFSTTVLKTNDAPDPDRIYDLVGAVIHVGKQMSSGHYISVVRAQGHWLLFDDEIVSVSAWKIWHPHRMWFPPCFNNADPFSLFRKTIPEAELELFFGHTDLQSRHARSQETSYILFYQARDFAVQESASAVRCNHISSSEKSRTWKRRPRLGVSKHEKAVPHAPVNHDADARERAADQASMAVESNVSRGRRKCSACHARHVPIAALIPVSHTLPFRASLGCDQRHRRRQNK